MSIKNARPPSRKSGDRILIGYRPGFGVLPATAVATTAATAATVSTAAATTFVATATAATVSTAAAAAFVATATATAVSATATATAAWACFTWFGGVHAKRAALVIFLVEAFDGRIELGLVTECHERKSLGLSGITVGNDFDPFDGSVCGEEVGDVSFSCCVGQIAHINVHLF